MSKYAKFIYAVNVCRKNGHALHIDGANIILDFENNTIIEKDADYYV